jgi:O-6-methylguanine DNA methyltransferase
MNRHSQVRRRSERNLASIRLPKQSRAVGLVAGPLFICPARPAPRIAEALRRNLLYVARDTAPAPAAMNRRGSLLCNAFQDFAEAFRVLRGAPKAVRAAARACAANPIAVAIPCHRVVRNDGALSGYR